MGPGLAILIVVVPLATGVRLIIRRREYAAKLGFYDSLAGDFAVVMAACVVIGFGIYVDYRMVLSMLAD